MDRPVETLARQPSKAIPTYPAAIEQLSAELMGYIADKWTLLVFEALAERDCLRFGELRRAVPGISQKMLTQTLRQMERIGLVEREVHAVIPPRVDYRRTALANSLGPLICSLWTWVENNASTMVAARQKFDETQAQPPAAV